MTTIPGYDCVLELGATPDDVSAVGNVINISERKADKPRNFFGSGYEGRSGGLKVLEFTYQGFVDSSEYGTLQGHFAAATAAFSLEIGDAGGTTAGTYAGTMVITELSGHANADGDWEFTVSGKSTGAYTFT